MKKPFISLKIVNKKGEVVKKIGSCKIKRIYHILQADKFKDYMFELSVRYSGNFKNEGDYTTKKDLIFALKAFTEKDLLKEFC